MENGNFNGREQRDHCQGRGNEHIHAGGIHLTVREQSDGALVFGLAGVRVQPFVQCLLKTVLELGEPT